MPAPSRCPVEFWPLTERSKNRGCARLGGEARTIIGDYKLSLESHTPVLLYGSCSPAEDALFQLGIRQIGDGSMQQ